MGITEVCGCNVSVELDVKVVFMETDKNKSFIEFIAMGINREAKDVTFLNPYSYVVFRHKREELEGFKIMIDGIALSTLLSWILKRKVPRESFDMTSVGKSVLVKSVQDGSRVAVIGSTESAIRGCVSNLKQRFTGINIVLSRNGYISGESDLRQVFSEINSARPQILVVGMGSGRQEDFLRKARLVLEEPYLGYTCGGFIHQSERSMDYYPKWVDQFNLRIFFRLCMEKGLISRHLKYYPLFMWYFAIDSIRFKLQRANR